MIEVPGSVRFDERLSALEDGELAQRLAAANPELFAHHPLASPSIPADDLAPSPGAAAWYKYAPILAIVTIVALVAGYVLSPLVHKRTAAPAVVRRPVAGAPPKPTAHHESPHKPVAASHRPDTQRLLESLRSELAAQQAQVARLRAQEAAREAAAARAKALAPVAIKVAAPARPVAALHPAAEPAARPATHPLVNPAPHAASRPIWDMAAHSASAPHAATAAQPASAVQTSTGTAAATSTGSAAANAAVPASDPGYRVTTADQPLPDGTKSAPPPPVLGNGSWTEHSPVMAPQNDPCTPTGGRIGIALGH